MKKNLLRLLACVLALAMVLSLAACGGGGGSSSSADSSSQSSSEDSSSSEESSQDSSSEESSTADDSADDKFASIQAFLDDPTVKSQLDSMIDSLTAEDDSMSVSVTGDGDKLVYLFTFSEEALAGADLETMGAALESAMEGQESVFENIASSVASVVDVADPTVVVTYAAHDGTVIYSQEFKAS